MAGHAWRWPVAAAVIVCLQTASISAPSPWVVVVLYCRATLAQDSFPLGKAGELGLGPQLGSTAVPGILVNDAVLIPGKPYAIKVKIGQAKFLPFNCMSGPADVVISLSTYSVHDDPLLFLSLDVSEAPALLEDSLSSFEQWREDSIGNHYVIARAVGPGGGIVGLMNLKPFAGEMLDGLLSIRCSSIIAFDLLFWDHLRDSAVCPIGLPSLEGEAATSEFCSGHGHCRKDGVCECDADYTGAACWSEKTDMNVAAWGNYDFQLAPGLYRYIRVRIPQTFPGGYLDVKLEAKRPMVLLIGRDYEPSKSRYDLSNFDDWVNSRNASSLQFKIDESVLPDHPQAAPVHGGLPPLHLGPKLTPGKGERRLDEAATCPHIITEPTAPACTSPECAACQDACMQCVSCKRLRSADDGGCTASCNMCATSRCLRALSRCADAWSCSGEKAEACQEKCGSCWGCMDSNDPECAHSCRCCRVCLPLAAKCDLLPSATSAASRWVIVGVFNPRRQDARRGDDSASEPMRAVADIALKIDPLYKESVLPQSWLAELYDPFQDLQSLALARSSVYPDGQPFLYTLHVRPGEAAAKKRVRLYRDRLTLVHVVSSSRWPRQMRLTLKGEANISHVLVSSRAAPKTMFDFEQVHVPVAGLTKISTAAERRVWCAIFGQTDGWVRVSAATYSTSILDHPTDPGGVLMLLLVFCGFILTLCFIYSGGPALVWACCCKESADRVPFSERLTSLVRTASMDDDRHALTRGASFNDAANIDTRLEDQYLHRGGFGDDGI